MRLVSMLQKLGLEDHETFVKHLLATHRNEQIKERNSTDIEDRGFTPAPRDFSPKLDR